MGGKLNDHTWSIRYADDTAASGDVYRDVVGIGGIWAAEQAVEVAFNISGEFTHENGADGILGLGFSSINSGTLV